MRPYSALKCAAVVALAVGLGVRSAAAQDQPVKPPPDEFRVILKEIEESYKAPFEVDKDVLDELRKQYGDPTPERETRIFRELRRLYALTPGLEDTILRELRRAYEKPTADQEARVFREIHRAEQLPPGTVAPDVLAERAMKTFRKFDRNQDGVLSSEEMPEFLRGQAANWDRNHDGVIDPSEYLAYFVAGFKAIGDRVASGEIPIKLPKAPAPETPPPDASPRSTPPDPAPKLAAPPAAAHVKLPDWFTALDEDHDGQVGLYEWKKAGRPIAEFLAMDRNHDGFLEAKELLAYLADHPSAQGGKRKER